MVAIDLGRPNSVKCEMGVDGKKVVLRFRLNREEAGELFGDRPQCRVLFESSTDSEWVALHLEGLGHEVIVADPNYAAMYGERNRKVKTDNRDAAALLDANRMGVYRRRTGAHRTTTCDRDAEDSDVAGADANALDQCGACPAARRGPSDSEWFIRELCASSEGDGAADDLRSLVQPLLDLMAPLNEQLTRLDREVAALGQSDSRVALLQTAPMVGPLTAAGSVALIDDVTRFPGPTTSRVTWTGPGREELEREEAPARHHQAWGLV